MVCKKCNQDKQHDFLCANSAGRAVYKDETGKLWHGRMCASCWAVAVWKKSSKKILSVRKCIVCAVEFKQRQIKQQRCEEHKFVRRKPSG